MASHSYRIPLTRRFVISGLAALAVAAVALPSAPAQAAASAEAYVSKVGASVIAAANSGSSSQFRSVLKQNADISAIALFSLGQYRKNLKPGQREEYFGLVEKYISGVFAQHSSKLKGQSLEVTGSREVKDSVVVESKLQGGGSSTPVVWRLVKRGGGYRIFDVNIQGIWLATTQKTNFTSVLQKNNGDVSALLAYLRQ
ncbi:MAG: phospholipid-binding protein MlaC [Parvibaculaceae bacterium]